MSYTLIQDDCIKVMQQLPDNSIDLIVTDCPYKIVSGGARSKNLGGIFDRNKTDITSGKIFKHNDIQFSEWLPEAFRIMKPGTHIYIMINGRNIKSLQIEAEKVGFKYVNILVWKKNNMTPNRYYLSQCEFILMLRKGKARTINNRGTSNIIEVDNIIGKKTHPTEKPVRLMEILIANSSDVSDVVLDQFMGTGSTGAACKLLNRDYIGVEIDEKYYSIAEQRIKSEENK